MVPIVIESELGSLLVHALLDSGANICALNTDIAEQLNLETHHIISNLGVFGSRKNGLHKVTSFTITNLDGTLRLKIKNSLVNRFLSTENTHIIKNTDGYRFSPFLYENIEV